MNSDTATLFEGKHALTASLKSIFMGPKWTSPSVAGSYARNVDLESIRQLEITDVGAIVLLPIQRKQIAYQLKIRLHPTEAIEQVGHSPRRDRYNGGPDEACED